MELNQQNYAYFIFNMQVLQKKVKQACIIYTIPRMNFIFNKELATSHQLHTIQVKCNDICA